MRTDSIRRNGLTAPACALGLLAMAGGAGAQQGLGNPLLPEGAVKQVSPHVYVIMGFPNIGIVVGDKATLVVDTGLGARNGALVAREAAKLSTKGQKLYLTTTHFHPEHAAGQGGFPAGTTVVRNRAQQAELEADGPRMIALFAARPGPMKDLLAGAGIGKADILFDTDYTLDLGGVQAKLFYFGAAHTLGDEIIFIPQDSQLIPGDVVQNKISPNVICDRCSPRQWIAVLDRIAPLKAKHVLPDHGDLGEGALVAQERGFLQDLQTRTMALKAQGVPADEAGKRIGADFAVKYVGWSGLGNVPQSVQRAYADKP
jgi:glyoxylase-like metal-dependent hydrolase (beta-lactamase superfamily II)